LAKIKKSLLAGGNSGDSKSKHFNDQAAMYRKFKDVFFTKKMSKMQAQLPSGE
jgi:hypothetical protein